MELLNPNPTSSRIGPTELRQIIGKSTNDSTNHNNKAIKVTTIMIAIIRLTRRTIMRF